MARYIDADKFEKYILDRYNTMEMVGINQVVNFIKEQPTANAKKVKHGKWIEHTKHGALCLSCHNYSSFTYPHQDYHYCPHCGVEMRKGLIK